MPQAQSFRPVHAMLDDLVARRLRSADLVEGYLARIERHDRKLHAFIAVYADEARRAAEAADLARAAGHAVGPLHGIPVAVKDIVEMAGRITTGGSKAWKARISAVTAALVERMVGAGMIVLGKTHTVEFAMGSFGTNRHLGTPWNPWDTGTHRAPGGSSAGSAVSVAAGLAPWAIGTDTGGSVRIPASWCGLTGLKTTIGRISCFGVLPLSPTLDSPGPLARDARDAALLYDLLRGPDPRDRLTLGQPEDDSAAHLGRGVEGLILGSLADDEREGVDTAVLAAYDAALETLAGLGAIIRPVPLPRRFDALGELCGRIIGAEGYSIVGELVDDPSLPIDDDVRPRIGIGRDMSARDYLRALRERDAVKAEFAPALAPVDALVTPTTATAALPVDAIDQRGTAARFTRPVNVLERCALAVPSGHDANGLPLSVQFVCPAHAESLALRIGRAFQDATQWHTVVPRGFE